MATTDLRLDEPGTLPQPGPVGRIVRLAFGTLCIWYVAKLVGVADSLIDAKGNIHNVIWNGIVLGLFLISYVINIGFSRAWRKWPALISAGVFLAVAGLGYLTTGSANTILLARAVWVWELYVFAHLGLAFVLSALLATPGCEMRALHDLYSRISGKPTKEHFCPVGPLNSIDRWEATRSD